MSNLPFGFDQPEDSPGFLLWKITMIWQRQIKKILEPYHISHAQFVIMATLRWFSEHRQENTQMLIVNQTQLDKMTVSIALKKLARLGFVHRLEHEHDARAKNLLLTQKGKRMVDQLVPLVEGIDSKFFGVINSSEQQKLIDTLAKILNNSPRGIF